MDTQEREVSRFIILIPHRDALKPLEEFRERLFAAGCPGAYSFPLVSPLARVSRPFSREELKELSRRIRDLTKELDGKISGSGTAAVIGTGAAETDKWPFFGPLLNLPAKETLFSGAAKDKILHYLLPPVLCTAIITPAEKPVEMEIPAISFRAASLANLAIRPLGAGESAYSFEWKIGPLVWLPNSAANCSL